MKSQSRSTQMTSKLPINIEDLLRHRTVERDRIEYKAGWNPDATIRTLVRVNPDGIEIVSYPGPDASIRIETLNRDKIVARRYRNRRIGEFLKELDLTEGRCTGIPIIRAAMAHNGSPPPRFSTDKGRTYFLVELPVHPDMRAIQTAQVTPQVTPQVVAMLKTALQPRTRDELQSVAGIKDREHFRKKHLLPILNAGWLERTIPNKPNSRLQKYRVTVAGRVVLDARGGDP